MIERNAIALLSRQDDVIDPPSNSWLGQHSDKVAIRNSGLWNVDDVDTSYTRGFLDHMERRIRADQPNDGG